MLLRTRVGPRPLGQGRVSVANWLVIMNLIRVSTGVRVRVRVSVSATVRTKVRKLGLSYGYRL